MTNSRTLLVWDAPNMDMGLSAIVGGRPNSYQRPRFDAAGTWLLAKTAEIAAEKGVAETDVTAEATLFTNVTDGNVEGIQSWIDALRNIGFSVFAKPKTTPESDVDADMLAHIAKRNDSSTLELVVVASADGRNFKATLDDLAERGVKAIVLGFYEECDWAIEDPRLEFIDVEDVDGLFQQPLPRMDLQNLPENGAWLPPFRPLRALLERATDHAESSVEDKGSED